MDADFTSVRALHPDWGGYLNISHIDNSVNLNGEASRGTYTLSQNILTVYWETFPPDTFHNCSGIYIHRDLLVGIPNVHKLLTVAIRSSLVTATKVSVIVPDADYEVTLRLDTSDSQTFEQIFIDKKYESPNLPASAHTILDLGANIGLATVFFGIKYPEASILSVEPDDSNCRLTIDNAAALGSRVRILQAAAWTNDGLINLHSEGEDGLPLGAWGIQVSGRVGANNKTAKCASVRTLIDAANFDRVDILKIDIEGAEQEIFSQGAEEWLPRANLVIVDAHDRFRPGTEEAVRRVMQPMFEELPRSGETLFFRRQLEVKEFADGALTAEAFASPLAADSTMPETIAAVTPSTLSPDRKTWLPLFRKRLLIAALLD
jgi:FkbM family methyltransferase